MLVCPGFVQLLPVWIIVDAVMVSASIRPDSGRAWNPPSTHLERTCFDLRRCSSRYCCPRSLYGCGSMLATTEAELGENAVVARVLRGCLFSSALNIDYHQACHPCGTSRRVSDWTPTFPLCVWRAAAAAVVDML